MQVRRKFVDQQKLFFSKRPVGRKKTFPLYYYRYYRQIHAFLLAKKYSVRGLDSGFLFQGRVQLVAAKADIQA